STATRGSSATAGTRSSSWAIDDFEIGDNALLFTPDYMAAMRAAQDRINPDLGFYTCAYMKAATSETFLDKYGPFIDGIIYPFLDGHHKNTTVATSVEACVKEILTYTGPRNLSVILLVYTGRFLDAPLPPTEDYVREVVATGLRLCAQGDLAGVIAYGTQQDGAPAPATDNRAMYGNGRLALFASRSPIEPGQAVSGRQAVPVDPDSPRHEISFWYRREFHPDGLAAGCFRLQVLLDDQIVWDMDVADQSYNLWMQGDAFQGPIDVTAAVRGKTSVDLAFRLTSTRGVSGAFVDVGIDNIETVGLRVTDPGFEEVGAWTVETAGPLVACLDRYAGDRPARILSTLGDVFGADSTRP
ncbi:hypothetical protein, partial [Asanoa sp. NPDC050611]|uniref:hypothetical protein n=1 Tax=Asanoa sp. NPDC050611 TaxID=3157098 RepID=UPI0033CAF102